MRFAPIILMLFAMLGCGSDSLPANEIETEEQAIAAIKRLGGIVTIDKKNPAKPMIFIALHNSKINDAGLEYLKGLTSLYQLNLEHTLITDKGLVHLKGLTKLQWLYFDHTKITDKGLVHLKGLTQLRVLQLNYTQVTDTGLEHLKELTGLQSLLLMGTKVTDEGVKTLQTALPNCEILY